MKRSGIIAVAVVLAMGLATASWAAGGGGGGGGAPMTKSGLAGTPNTAMWSEVTRRLEQVNLDLGSEFPVKSSWDLLVNEGNAWSSFRTARPG